MPDINSSISPVLQELKRLFGEKQVTLEGNVYTIVTGSHTSPPYGEEEDKRTLREEALKKNNAPIDALRNRLKAQKCDANFVLSAITSQGVETYSYTVNKQQIENPQALATLKKLTLDDIDPSREWRESRPPEEIRAGNRQQEIVDRFNKFLYPARWRLIETENGPAITTLRPVTNPAAVSKALGFLFDAAIKIPSAGQGHVTILLATMDDFTPTQITDKIRGSNLETYLQPAEAQRAAGS